MKQVVKVDQPIDANVEKIAWSFIERVAAGDVRSLAYVCVTKDGRLWYGHTRQRDGYTLIGALEDLKHDLLHAMT